MANNKVKSAFKRLFWGSLFLLFSIHTLAQNMPNPPANIQTLPAGCFIIPMDTVYQSIVPAGQAPFNLAAYGLVNRFLQNGIPVKWVINSDKELNGLDFTATAERYSPSYVGPASMNFKGSAFIVPDTVLPCGMSTTQIINSFGRNVAVYRLDNSTSADVRYTLTHRPKIAVFNNGGNQLIHTKILDAAGITNYDVMDAADIDDLINCYTFASEPHADSSEISMDVVNAVRAFVMNGGNFLAQCHAIEAYENRAFFQTTRGINVINTTVDHAYPNADLPYSQFEGELRENEGGSIHNWTLADSSQWRPYSYISVSNIGTDTVVATVAHLTNPSAVGGNVFYLGGHDYSKGGKNGAPSLTTLSRVNGLRMYLNAIFVPSANSNGAWANAGGPSVTISCTDSVVLGCNQTGPPGSTFLWTPAAGLSCTTCPNPVAKPKVSTTYKVTVTNGCVATDTIRVNVEPIPIARFSNNRVCAGATTTFTDLSVGSNFWLWDFGDTASHAANTSALRNPTHTFSKAGTFYVRLIVGTKPACADTIIQPVIIDPLPVLAVNTPMICPGQTIVLTVSGAATYSWSTGSTSSSISVKPAGTTSYTVTGTSSAGCKSTATTTVTVVPPLAPSVSTTNVSCYGGADGTLTIAVTGGKSPYKYSWNTLPVQTTATATGVKKGTYTVTVVDSIGCTVAASATVTEPLPLLLTTGFTNVKCFGGSDGQATVTASGGTAPYTYSWNSTPVQTTAIAAGLPKGTYTVTVADSKGCTTTATATVSEPTLLTATVSTVNVKCFGGNDGSATLTATGGTPGYTYLWGTSPVQTSLSAKSLKAGTYTATVTDANGCIFNTSATITEPPLLTASVSVTNVKCKGGSDGSALVTASGGTPGYSYSWNTSPLQATSLASGLKVGVYTATVTDANGCATLTPATIAEPTLLTATAVSTNVKCFGGSDGSASVSAAGGTPGYTYSWNTTPAQTSASAAGLKKGSYTVTVTDLNGCTTQTTVAVSEPTLLTATTAPTNVKCFGGQDGAATVTASGGTPGYSYSWNTTPVQTTIAASGLSAGSNTITVTDANGCIVTASVTITQPTPLTLTTSVNNVRCFGGNDGSALASVAGGTPGYSYSWSTLPVQTATQATGLKAGSYTIKATDANGCTITAIAAVNEPPLLTATVSVTNAKCKGSSDGTASVSAAGGTPGYTYSWNTSPLQTTALASGLKAGLYTATLTDANGCTTSAPANISEPPLLTAQTVVTNVKCYGGADGAIQVTSSGGTPGYAYSWDNMPVQSGPYAPGLKAGTYSITVTDTNACSTKTTATIIEPTPLTADVVTTDAKCGSKDGTASASVAGGTPGYVYLWNTAPAQTTAIAQNLSYGIYTVTATDGNGCVITASGTVIETKSVMATVSPTPVKCHGGNDGTALVSPSGGAPDYSYLWNTIPAQTNALATGLAAGTYTVTVQDANKCSYTTSVTIEEPTAIELSSSSTDPTCVLGGTATVSATGGTPPYSYAWNTPTAQTAASATNLPAGVYTATVSDANNCIVRMSVTLMAPAVPMADFTFTTGCSGSGANLFTDRSSVASPHSIVSWDWSFGNPASGAGNRSSDQNPSHFYNAAGTYTALLVVTTDQGCKDTAAKTVEVYPLPVVRFGPFKEGCGTVCLNLHDSSSVSSGTIEQWSWDFGDPASTDNTSTLENPSHCYTRLGSYDVSLRVTTDHGCTAESVLKGLAKVNASPVVDLGPDQTICTEREPAALQLNAGPGAKFYWSPTGDTTQTISINASGAYSVTVTNGAGCTGSDEIRICDACEPRVILSNSFSPNNDGINELYSVYGKYDTDFHMLIFNRWGEIIFESMDRKDAWDGYYRGEPMPIGVYPWIITYKGSCGDNTLRRMEGSVTVVR